VSDSLGETELAWLLAQLLRVVNPPTGATAATPPDGEPAAAASTPDGQSRPGGLDGQAGTAGLDAVSAISTSEARALIELVAARGIAQGELGGLLGLEKSTVSRLAAGLERKGWIRRGRDEGNQRYVRLYLTPRGQTVAARVLDTWQSRQRRILASLTADERAGLELGLRGLVRGLAVERIPADAGPRGDAPPGGAG
jgi:DNA-binding MarR family transcriptional regulator